MSADQIGKVSMKKPALFIDRDGTLVYNCPYCKNEDEIRVYEDVFRPIAELSKSHYIIIVTNQSGIARGFFGIADIDKMNKKVEREIGKRGGRVDAVYYCPHLPEDNCDCRKPKLGMLNKAFADFEIDRSRSFIIGDDDRDMELAKGAGIRSIRVRKDGIIQGDFFAEDFYGVLEIVKGVDA